ncbi:hypothetical protein O7622_05640 [Micromonospora sp. WMMD1076]|uniref:hypothetical protein n=1 Tax=Micromonospora sp. WMMD1076 TaxID=3016103 RepID=UPI00249C1E2D|nr:hypothetical protein [Micromonospora sp. WMMD1076]WFF08055.1 hypothetical protein O7622_05640 [Micromonospora sp. WMMD1076]
MRAVFFLRGNAWLTVLAGVVLGVSVGVAVFAAGQLTGWRLAALVGGFVGLVLAPIFRVYSTAGVEIRDIKVKVPQFGEASFVLQQDSRMQAYRLYAELSTRVATTPLPQGTGLVSEAMASLHSLFTITREVIATAPPPKRGHSGPTVLDLGLRMLNIELRPFLSYWRPRFVRWEKTQEKEKPVEDEWPDNEVFRAELAALQPRMREFMYAFARLAELTDDQMRITWPQDVELPEQRHAPATTETQPSQPHAKP